MTAQSEDEHRGRRERWLEEEARRQSPQAETWTWVKILCLSFMVLAVVALLGLNVWAKKTVDKINWLGGP
jgi:hypothetical protein